MNRMRETTTTTNVTQSVDHERNLDALLEDLQTTVSRSNSSANLNGNVTGYREFRRTYTDGTPEGTTSEYQIEYLNPSNSTHHMVESSYSGLQNPGTQRSKTTTSSYKYETSGTRSSDNKMKQNISELDSLLDDLNSAQKRSFSENSTYSSRNISTTDPGLLDQNSSHSLVRAEQKSYNEDKALRGRSPSARRELVFTGQRSRDPSPMKEQLYFEQHDQTPKVQQFYRYEKTTSTRTTAPTMTDLSPLPEPGNVQGSTVRNYTYSDESPLPLRHRSPSPGGGVHSYQYSNSSTRDVTSSHTSSLDRYRTPTDDYPTKPTGSSYNYSSTMRESRSESRGKTPPPPHRSPSPVSFNQPPPPIRSSTTVKSYTYDQQNNNGQSPHSPIPGQKFSPSDPSRLTYPVTSPNAVVPPTQQYHNNSVTNYKYTTTTTTHQQNYNQPHSPNNMGGDDQTPLMPRPFPTPQHRPTTPSNIEQQPPKKLDELMASFSDTDQRHNRYTETSVHHYTSNNTTQKPQPQPQVITLYPSNENEKMIEKEKESQRERYQNEKEKQKLMPREETNNVSGPPVYYPPGVELFAKKEESMMQQQSGGGKYRAKAKYEYEAKSKSKMKESSGKAVVPVCLPLCCAMPCSIM